MVNSSALGLEEQLILRIDKELRSQLDDIITTMQKELAHKFEIKQVKERSPFKNVLTVATDTTSSLEVIKNYIRYQAARKEASRIWRIEITENGKKQVFADAVVQQIDGLSKNFQNIFDAIDNSLAEEIDSLLLEEIKVLSKQEIESLLSQALESPLVEEIESLNKDSTKPENLKLLKKHLQENYKGSTKRQNLELLRKHLHTSEQRLKQFIHLNLAQLYLGYLSREHTALVGYGRDGNEQPQSQKPKNK